MKNKKGFTLIELLAVIVILAIITAVVSSTLIKTKKRSNIDNVKTYESTLENLGMQMYYYERDNINDALENIKEQNPSNPNPSLKITVEKLVGAKYIDELSNPAKAGDKCIGYLEITNDLEFKGVICCSNLYKTGTGEFNGTCNANDYTGYEYEFAKDNDE